MKPLTWHNLFQSIILLSELFTLLHLNLISHDLDKSWNKKQAVAVMAQQFLSKVNSEDQACDKRAPHHPVALMIVRCYNTKTVK